jgi:hypothetical protein
LEGLPSDNAWANFVGWAARFRALPNYTKHERDPKRQIAERLAEARETLLSGGEWLHPMRSAFAIRPSIVNWRLSGPFLDWCKRNPTMAKELLRNLWQGGDVPLARFAAFQKALPATAASGVGSRTNLGSFLIFGIDSYPNYPPYRATAFETAYSLTGFSELSPEVLRDEVGIYEVALNFLDIFKDRAAERGLNMEDRLDAQGTLWCIAKWPIPSDWPNIAREEFRLYRKNSGFSESDYEIAVSDAHFDPTDDLDRPRTAAGRAEQAFLRKQLFKSNTHANCALCGRELPVEMLIAAHIKGRARCTRDERLDVPAIVMAACKLGCDSLYELGYIFVDSGGRIQLSAGGTDSITQFVHGIGLIGRNTHARPRSDKYFEWHRQHVGRTPKAGY